MSNFFSQAISGLLQQSPLELIAVVFALAYLVLAMRQNIWCWACAFISTALYTWIFFDVSLVMESLLNVYYMAMAVFGYWSWNHSRKTRVAPEYATSLAISTWSFKQHALALGLVGILTLVSGFLLAKNTEAAWPYLDSFTTWGAVITTYMVARKIFENWIYWLVVDSAALFLYIERGLYPTAFLMMIYLALVVVGLITWHRELHADRQPQQMGA